MAKTRIDEVFDRNGAVVQQITRIVPDTKIEKALLWLTTHDPTTISSLAEAKPYIVAHHRILTAMLRAFQQGLFDEEEDGTI